MSANDRQEGGDHYIRLDPEPWDVVEAWGLDFYTGNALKYIVRAGRKNDDVIGDLRKAIHYLQKALEVREKHEANLEASSGNVTDAAVYFGSNWSAGESKSCPTCGREHGQQHVFWCTAATCSDCHGLVGGGHYTGCSAPGAWSPGSGACRRG